jgi:putative N6-adenine-specific DNA methylase
LEGFLSTPPNLGSLAARELNELGLGGISVLPGGVSFTGTWRDIYRVNLWSRTGNRVLARVARFPAHSFRELSRNLKALPWSELLDLEAGAAVHVSTKKTVLYHTGKIEEIVRESAGGLKEGKGAELYLRLSGDRATLSVDTTGEHLHRRGYRKLTGEAPMRENLAAALLMLAGYEGREPLLDPCCGSGTFPVEGVLMALNIAPGLRRRFGFERLPAFDAEAWQDELALAREAAKDSLEYPIFASDIDPEAVALAVNSAKAAEVGQHIEVAVCDMEELSPPAKSGLLVANPPYGIRIGDSGKVYGKIKRLLSGEFSGWRYGVVAPAWAKASLPERDKAEETRFLNGGMELFFKVSDHADATLRNRL